jgi:hypothetical protein
MADPASERFDKVLEFSGKEWEPTDDVNVTLCLLLQAMIQWADDRGLDLDMELEDARTYWKEGRAGG